MLIITEKIRKFLKEKNITQNEFARKIDYKPGTFGNFILGKKPFPEKVIDKIAPILEVSAEEIEGWILADRYPKEVLKRAIDLKKEKLPDDNRLILMVKLDEILQLKGLSRTGLSKLINYSQGGLNEMIIGKEPMSKGVIQKISQALGISEDEIKSWIIANKYSSGVLEVAFLSE